MAHGVCFPGVLKERVALSPDAPPEIIIDRADLDRLASRVESIFDLWQGQDGPTEPLGDSGMDAVRNLLARSFELRTPLGRVLIEEEREILRLSEEQFSLLDFLARTRRAAIHGGAGSGKTVLALEKAKRLAREGFRTLLTCYNVPLEAHLRASADGVEHLTIQRFHTLCEEAARATGNPAPSHPPDHPDAAHWTEVLPQALDRALNAGFEKFDAIVVDEGQDMAEEWWLLLRLCLKDPDGGILYAFLDTGQLIFSQGGDFLDDLPPFQLSANLRNTRQIHQLGQRFSQGHNMIPRGPEGRPPEIKALPEGADLARELGRVLHRLIHEEKVPPGDIAILLGRRPESVGLPRTGSIGAFPITNALEPDPGKVTLETIHRFKGMEAPVVILAGLEGMFAGTAETLLYVGITRAKGHLVVLEKKEVLEKWGLKI
ncbi:MAG: ATP-binding domain-containing protein [SAR324 cluster bacterium]|nr:ATP-binding domain-containing protein [SAR324 cluster bacterium]